MFRAGALQLRLPEIVLWCVYAYQSTISAVDFSAPYRVITSTMEGPILHALSGVETPLTRGQILALVENASEAGVRKALGRLVDQGIVIEHRVGSRFSYSANREHLLWESVETLFAARRLLRGRVESQIATWDVAPLSVELFGSVARGESDATSDVDLLIVRPTLTPAEEEIWGSQVADLRDQIVRWTGNSCDIVVLDPEEFQHARAGDEPILRPPTSNLAGVRLAELLDQSNLAFVEQARAISEDVARQAQLSILAQRVNDVLSAQRDLKAVVGAFEASSAAAKISSGLQAQLEAVRPVLQIDTSALEAAARIANPFQALGVTDGSPGRDS